MNFRKVLPPYSLTPTTGQNQKMIGYLEDLCMLYEKKTKVAKRKQLKTLCKSSLSDLNGQPADYKSAALPIELRKLKFKGALA